MKRSDQFQNGNNSSIVITTYINNRMNDEQAQTKAINISVDNIEINHSKMQRDPKLLQAENKIIKRQNLLLKKQLESLSCRLDSQITKRMDSKRKEGSTEDVALMQLQNSYKKCEIYKREAMVYRKKYQSLTEDPRFADFERKIVEYQKKNTQLKNEIKHMNKILKSQSKGLVELGFEGYPSIVMERDQLKEEVRILKKQLAEYRRSVDARKKLKKGNPNSKDRNGHSSQENNDSLEDEPEVEENIKQTGSSRQNTLKHDRQNELEALHKKIEKESQKIKSLQAEKNKLRDFVDNLKTQLAEKQKENSHLRDKINELRSNNQLLQSNFVKSGSHSNQNKLKKIKLKHRYVESEQSQHGTEELKPRNGQKVKKKLLKKQARSDPENKDEITISNSKSVFRREDTEDKSNSLIKWNHQHLSSMIKELQILQHQDGHIIDLHVRYQKGEPKKYSTYRGKNNYKIFTCSSDEYIKHVEGVFDQGYLQYLMVTSNFNRVEKYGKFQFYEHSFQGEHFRFEVGENGFPGALFGQKDSCGIMRLGCFIHKES